MTTTTLEREIDNLSFVDLQRIYDYVAAKKQTAELSKTESDPYPDDPLNFGEPNEDTLASFHEIEEGGGIRCSSAEDLFAQLGI